MATVIKRKNPSGAVVYRAQVRVRKEGYPDFSESRTFSKKVLAVEWARKREAEIEADPSILLGRLKRSDLSLADAMRQYLDEVKQMGRSKRMGLRFLTEFPIGRMPLSRLRRSDFADHVMMRRRGLPDEGIEPIGAATALQELQYIRTVLKHAFYVWDVDVGWQELDFAVDGLRRSGLVSKSSSRERLPLSSELQALTSYFFRQWQTRASQTPMHLIMWLAIYTARRQDEICRLMFADRHVDAGDWLLRDVKHPSGSVGNHKRFDVLPLAVPVIDALCADDVRRRMGVGVGGRADSLVPLNSRSISASWTRACKVLGIEGLRFHDLRHEAATRLAEDGLTIPQIQRITLHDSWGSLQRYVNIRRRADRLDFAEAMQQAVTEFEAGK